MSRATLRNLSFLLVLALGVPSWSASPAKKTWADIEAEYKRLKEQYKDDPSGYLAAVKRLEASVIETHASEATKRHLADKQRLLAAYGRPDSLIEVLPHDDEPGRLIDPEGWRVAKELKEDGSLVVTAVLHERYKAPPRNVEIMLIEHMPEAAARNKLLTGEGPEDSTRIPLAVREHKPGVYQAVYRLSEQAKAMLQLHIRGEIEPGWHVVATLNPG